MQICLEDGIIVLRYFDTQKNTTVCQGILDGTEDDEIVSTTQTIMMNFIK